MKKALPDSVSAAKNIAYTKDVVPQKLSAKNLDAPFATPHQSANAASFSLYNKVKLRRGR